MTRHILTATILLFAGAVRAGELPFDRLARDLAPYVSPQDPLGLPMKLRAVSRDPYSFWRGTRVLFHEWCGQHSRDWLGDRGAYVASHGDLHLGNIGTYPIAPWGSVAFGMVDFDDSDELPFQLELLSGLITLELVASQRSIPVSDDARRQLVSQLLSAYTSAAASGKSATELLSGESAVRRLMERTSLPYSQEVDSLTTGSRFKSVDLNSKGVPREVLRNVSSQRQSLCNGIAQAIAGSKSLQALFGEASPETISAQFLDATARTRVGSSGSQGLQKYLVLLRRPLRDYDGDVIVYLKRAIPSAAQRAGIIPPVEQDRASEILSHVQTLTAPSPLAIGSCVIEGKSYLVTLKEPWSDELDPSQISTFDELLHQARIWGTVAGAAHARAGPLPESLPAQLLERSAAYRASLELAFRGLVEDARTTELIRQADDTLSRAVTGQ